MRYYFVHNGTFEIIQADIKNLNVKHLMEKSPIVIHDKLVNIQDLFATLFKYLYVFNTLLDDKDNNGQLQKCTSRFTVVHMINDGTLRLVHPDWVKNTEDNVNYKYVEIPLEQYQTCIIPTYWFMLYEPGKTKTFCLDGPISKLVSYFQK